MRKVFVSILYFLVYGTIVVTLPLGLLWVVNGFFASAGSDFRLSYTLTNWFLCFCILTLFNLKAPK